MKLSVKLLQDHHDDQTHHQITPQSLLLRAKIPITIFNLPFISHFTTTANTKPNINRKPNNDLSLSLSTNFTSGPSLKLTYNTTTQPLSLSLKSGTGLFGSPNNSPLVISAHFSFNPGSHNPNPTFSLVFKPRFGSFSLRKSTFSHGSSDMGSSAVVVRSDLPEPNNSFGFVPLERPSIPVNKGLGDVDKGSLLSGNNSARGSILKNDEKDSIFENRKDSIFKGFNIMANTDMPVLANRLNLNFRWCVGFDKGDIPVLKINKIGIHRIDNDMFGRKEDDDEKRTKKESLKEGELELLKGMCSWMKREVDVLASANRDMRFELDEMKKKTRGEFGGDSSISRRAKKPVIENGGGFEQWRNNKRNGGNEDMNGYADRKKEEKRNGNSVSLDVESELERAIKAASSTS